MSDRGGIVAGQEANRTDPTALELRRNPRLDSLEARCILMRPNLPGILLGIEGSLFLRLALLVCLGSRARQRAMCKSVETLSGLLDQLHTPCLVTQRPAPCCRCSARTTARIPEGDVGAALGAAWEQRVRWSNWQPR